MPSIAPRFDADVLHKKSKSSKVKTLASDSEDDTVAETTRVKESRKEKKEKAAGAGKEKRKKAASDSSESSDSDAPASKKLKTEEAEPTRLSVEEFRRKLEIKVAGNDCPAPFQTFEDASLPTELLEAVRQQGFKAPSAIQSQCWPLAMAGKDVIAIAKTGSGKTCGFLFPAFQLIKRTVSLQ
eukprot:383964-Hanusia_phi.AAC.1